MALPISRQAEGAAAAERALITLAEAATAGLTPHQVLEFVAAAATTLTGAATVHLWLVGDDGQELKLAAEYGGRPGKKGIPLLTTLKMNQGLVGTIAQSREAIVLSSVRRERRLAAREWVRDQGLVSFAGVPFARGQRLLGVLCLFTWRRHRFTRREVNVLRSFAAHAAVALETARLLRLASARAERVKAAAEVGQLLASTRDADRILDLIAEKSREVLGAEAFGLFRFDATGRLRYVRGFGLDEAFMREHTLAVGEGVVGKAAAERRSIETADLLRDPAITLSDDARARVEREGSRAIVAVPILIPEEVLGVLAVYHPVGFRIPTEEAEFLETLTNHAAAALENARLFAETRRRRESAETLAAITQALTGSLDLRSVISLVAETIRRLLGCEGGAIDLTGSDGSVRLAARIGLGADAFRDVVVRPGEGVTGWVLKHSEPFWTADYANDPRTTPVFAAQVQAAGIASVLAVPVRLRDETVGVLCGFYGRVVQIGDDDVTLASDLARVVAVAVANARLYEEARQREAEARALFEVGRLIGATLDTDRVFDLIVEKALDLMRVRACGIFRLDGDTVLRYARGVGLSPAFVGQLTVPLGEGTSGQSVAERVPVWTADLLADGRITLNPTARRLVEHEGYRAVLSVPILIQGAPFGCLATYWWEPHVPAPGEVETLSSLATLAAVAIENARLYGEARGHFEQLTQAYQDLKTAQEQLVRTEKLRALGEMASGVAHDFNNLLAAILGRVQLIQRKVGDPTLKRWLEVIEQAALDGAQTVRQIQEFTRVRRDQPTQTVDLNRVVRDAVEVTRPRWQSEPQSRGLDVRVIERLESVPPVDGHPAELRDVLANLILNAVDALPHGGTITIATHPANGAVEVSVTDTGQGMSDSVRRRIFEPFFSTKGPKGRGLGLAMVYGIVSRHGGGIAVESKEGVGSTFTVHLPISGDQPTAAAPPRQLLSDSTIRVLVIDDEEHVREILADMLRLLHHEVVVAEYGAQGIERFRGDTFDLVMTDLAMPGTSGWQVAQAIKAFRPDVPVILVTGWGVEVPADQLRASGVDRVLTKPFGLEDVRGVVASFRNRAEQGRIP